ncbi:NLR family CARD domain-containing protein 3-like [Branchiostoma lanceolatum]|uniref:NLR family CARD domain-containing protein 3-like n=1 Tax=Branchiostoma lanceolatum TaxID=7740 RepID=UPI003451F627
MASAYTDVSAMAGNQSRLGRAISIVVENGGKTAVKPLARKVGLRENDIDTITVAAPQDLAEQTQQMLRLWRERRGTRATPSVLVEACRQVRLTDVAEKIQRAMDRGTISEPVFDDVYVGNACEKALKKYYKKTQSYYTPLNWCPWVELGQKDNNVPVRVNRITRELCTPAGLAKEELMTENDAVVMAADVKRVIFEGPPGIGKTTLLRNIVCHWSNGQKFEGLKMMFALKARHLKASEDLFDAIYQHNILPRDFAITKDRLKEWVHNNQEKVMFIIDAVEETPGFSRDHFVARLIFGNYLRESYVVLTTTAIHNLKAPILKSCDAYYVVEGFNQDDIDTFVGKFFKNDKEAQGMRELLTQYGHTGLSDLCKTPMYLMLLCLLWKEKDRTRPDTVTGLFEGIVDISLRKYCEKHLHLDPKEEIPEDLQRKLDELYELSWNTLVNEKGPIVLKETEVKNIRESMVKLGFLIKEKGHQAEKFAFGHRLLRELFAAKYVVKMNRKELYDMMWSKGCRSMHKFNTVCLFTAGLLGEHANPLFESFTESHNAMAADVNCSQCCIDTNTILACRCIVESTQPRRFGLFVAETLTANMGSGRVISLNFFRRHPKLNTLLGLSYIVENIICLDDHGRVDDSKRISLVLDNLWIYRQKGLARLGQAIMKTRCIDGLSISATGLDVSLTNPWSNDSSNEGMYSFFEAIGDPRSMVRALTILAQIDRMSESAIQAIPEAFKNNVNLEQLDLFTLFSKRCSYRCDNDRRNLCVRTKHIEMLLTDVAKAIEGMTNLRSLRISANILREEMSKTLFVPALENHSSIRTLHVVGQVKGRGHLTMTGVNSLAGILEKNRKLEAVSIRLTTVSEDTGEPLAAALCEGLCQTSAASVEVLFNCLLPREARIFADIVKTNANVTDVTYSWHTMFPSFLKTLAGHVRASATLERLVLCGKFEDGKSLVTLVKAAKANEKLGSLVLNGKYFLDETVAVVTACLKERQEDRELERPFILHLSGDVVGDEAEAVMAELDQLSKSCADHKIVVYNTLSVETHPDAYIGSLQLRAAMKAKRERRRTASEKSLLVSETSFQEVQNKVRKRRRGKKRGRNREERTLSIAEANRNRQNWLKWHIIIGLIITVVVIIVATLGIVAAQ